MPESTNSSCPTRVIQTGAVLPHGPDARIQLEQFIAGVPPAGLEVGRVTYKPGADTGHGQHPGQEFLVFLEGALDVYVGDEKYHLQAGNAIHFDATQAHRGHNTGSVTCVAVYVNLRGI
jgi:quercetin dioxygenase-like cupin family protein